MCQHAEASIADHLLPYSEQLEARERSSVSLLVIHCTELPDLATAREYALRIHYPDSRTGNAGHYYIDRDGHIERYVPIERVAHHVAGQNRHSIGIELVNEGRFPHWHHSDHQRMTQPYPTAQIAALGSLINQLEVKLASLQFIAGHEDLDRRVLPASDDATKTVLRKMDPGPLFPWAQVLENTRLQRLTAEPTSPD